MAWLVTGVAVIDRIICKRGCHEFSGMCSLLFSLSIWVFSGMLLFLSPCWLVQIATEGGGGGKEQQQQAKVDLGEAEWKQRGC